METLQKRTFYGKEKKSLAYVIAIMNMILHGIEAPNILHTNTLSENINDIQEKDRVRDNPRESSIRRSGAQGSPEQLQHQDGRNRLPLPAALHQDA